MLTNYKDVRPKKDVKNPLRNVFTCEAFFRKFFRKGAPNFDILSSVLFFFSRIILTQKALEGSGNMLPRKIFENLHTVVAVLAF